MGQLNRLLDPGRTVTVRMRPSSRLFLAGMSGSGTAGHELAVSGGHGIRHDHDGGSGPESLVGDMRAVIVEAEFRAVRRDREGQRRSREFAARNSEYDGAYPDLMQGARS
jgi:hypothetical protein